MADGDTPGQITFSVVCAVTRWETSRGLSQIFFGMTCSKKMYHIQS